jgi:hypothetical protein
VRRSEKDTFGVVDGGEWCADARTSTPMLSAAPRLRVNPQFGRGARITQGVRLLFQGVRLLFQGVRLLFQGVRLRFQGNLTPFILLMNQGV